MLKLFARLFRRHRCLTAEDDPVLARIWDNEDDAIYDDEREAEEGMRHLSLKALERGDWLGASAEGLERWEAAHGLGEEA